MKKYLSIALALLLLISVTACGNEKEQAQVPAGPDTQKTEIAEMQSSEIPAGQEEVQKGQKEVQKENDTAAKPEDESKNTDTALLSEMSEENKEENDAVKNENRKPEANISAEGIEAESPVNEEYEYISEDIDISEDVPEEAIDAAGMEVISEDPAGVAGVYTISGVKDDGVMVGPDDLETNIVLTLDEDGTGNAVVKDFGPEGVEEYDPFIIEKWGFSNGSICIFFEDGNVADGYFENGSLVLDPLDDEDDLIYFTK